MVPMPAVSRAADLNVLNLGLEYVQRAFQVMLNSSSSSSHGKRDSDIAPPKLLCEHRLKLLLAIDPASNLWTF